MTSLENTIIDNELVKGSGSPHEKFNPSTEEAILEFRHSSDQQLDAAVSAAHAAAQQWRHHPPELVAQLMLKAAGLLADRKEAIAKLGAAESGITFSAILGMVDQTVHWLNYYAGWTDKISGEKNLTVPDEVHFHQYEPLGVIGVITPSNSTVSAMVLPPILAARNTVVFKTPDSTAQVMALFLKCFVDAGFPKGVINCVNGDGLAGEKLTRHPLIDKIHFTGSPHVGKIVGKNAAEFLKPCALELGGKSANIICPDADLDGAAEMVLRTLTRQSGQSCVAGTRVMVHDAIADQVLEKTLQRLKTLRIGNAADPATEFGPVVSRAAQQRIAAEIMRAQADGDGTNVTEGMFDDKIPDRGYFIPPTIFDRVDNRSPLAQEETFGPVISMIRYGDIQDAIAMANDSQYGLAGYIQTASLKNALDISRQLQAGILWVNGCTGIKPYMPFGGMKSSGYGRVGGQLGLLEFMKAKSVWISIA